MIADDLRICHALDRMAKDGRDTDNYRTKLTYAVLTLTGIINRDVDLELTDWYCREIERITETEFPSEDELLTIAERILSYLVTWAGSDVDLELVP